jgi:hypothetical protein
MSFTPLLSTSGATVVPATGVSSGILFAEVLDMPRSSKLNEVPSDSELSSLPADSALDPNTVARRAYARFLERGSEHGRDVEDWLEAEREVAAAHSSLESDAREGSERS